MASQYRANQLKRDGRAKQDDRERHIFDRGNQKKIGAGHPADNAQPKAERRNAFAKGFGRHREIPWLSFGLTNERFVGLQSGRPCSALIYSIAF
jgi:hypothetical protein